MHQICTEKTVRCSEAAERNDPHLLCIVLIVIHRRKTGEFDQFILDTSIELIPKTSVKCSLSVVSSTYLFSLFLFFFLWQVGYGLKFFHEVAIAT